MCFQAIDTGRATRQIARKWVARSVCLQIFRDGRGCGSPTPVAPLCASKEELSHLGLPVEWGYWWRARELPRGESRMDHTYCILQ
jgi:hypothetical protein